MFSIKTGWTLVWIFGLSALLLAYAFARGYTMGKEAADKWWQARCNRSLPADSCELSKVRLIYINPAGVKDVTIYDNTVVWSEVRE